MSLPDFDTQINFFSLQRQVNFTEHDRYRLFFEKIYPELVKARTAITKCYCLDNGRPGAEPVVLLGVTLLQFMERLPDRQAVEQLHYHVGWKYALNQELNSEVFDASVLSRFRDRLLAHDAGRLIFETVQEALINAGLIPKRGRQRLDSTHVLGLVKRMSHLDCIREALRLALEELKGKLEKSPEFWDELEERYIESRVDYRASEKKLQEKMQQAGQDAWRLLAWVDDKKIVGPKCELLRRVFGERFHMAENEITAEPIMRADHIQNPHDPDARYRSKGTSKAWVGYTMQVAETVAEEKCLAGEPTRNFITSIVTQPANGSDEAGMAQTLIEQEQIGIDKPSELYVDGAYVSGKELAVAEKEKRELLGPAISARTGKSAEFNVEDFDVDINARKAVCPCGQTSPQCSRIEYSLNGGIEYRFEWSWRCRKCPGREKCLTGNQKHRTIRVGEYHMFLQARRREMRTEVFREKMKRRCGIEGTQSELVRGYGARRARYRSMAKVKLQNYFIGAACNVKRWLRRIEWEIQSEAYALRAN